MKLLIVDDEKIIRRGIVNCFCWSDFGIADVYEAKNGKEALAVFRQYKPNIVLTDIRMPLMDGLAFAEEIRRESAATQIIYITGFSDVDYLRAAVKNAAVDYIMKPVDPQELKAAVNKAVKNCQNTQRAQRRYLALEQLALQSRPLLTRQLLLSLLHANYPSKEAVAQKAKLLGLPFDLESTFIVAVISVQRGKVVSQKYDDDLFSAGFENVAAEILGQQAPGFIFSCGNLEFAAVVSAGEIAAPQLQGLFKKLQGAVRHYLGAEAFVVIGPEVEGLFSLQESYAHARTGLKQQFRFSPGALVSYEDCSAVSQGAVK